MPVGDEEEEHARATKEEEEARSMRETILLTFISKLEKVLRQPQPS
jgi:hypothetical protein